jgi:RNA polymerase sigma-70 factor (ECF subfamily)
LAIDNIRKNTRNQTLELDVLFDMPDGSPDFERQIYSQQQIAHLKLAIAELPPRSRDVFVMHKFKHYPYSKIMSELGIAESTVLQHIVKAMTHCRKRMSELDQTNNS